jgi:hypothetical protein
MTHAHISSSKQTVPLFILSDACFNQLFEPASDMYSDTDGQRTKPVVTAEVRAFLGAIGTGWRAFSRDKRVLLGKMNASKSWELRRKLYGSSGQRDKPYSNWRKARGMPPLSSDSRS